VLGAGDAPYFDVDVGYMDVCLVKIHQAVLLGYEHCVCVCVQGAPDAIGGVCVCPRGSRCPKVEGEAQTSAAAAGKEDVSRGKETGMDI